MKRLNKFPGLLVGTLVIFLSACNPGNKDEFQQQLSVKVETLQIDNTKDTLIFGAKGTGLFFEKESFELPDGNLPKGKISIQLKECYATADIVRENLSTTADGQLLETNGMINVTANADGQELKLKQGKKFIIHFPKDTSERKKQMSLFYPDINKNGTIEWKLDSATILKPTAYMSGWSYTGYEVNDTTKHDGFHFKGQKNEGMYDYFYKNFNNSKLQSGNGDLSGKIYNAKFILNKQGKITNIKITEVIYDSARKKNPTQSKPDPYLYTYMEQIPALEPFYSYGFDNNLKPFDSECSFDISFGLFPPDYRNNENYSRLFNKKYSAFKNNAIASMNEAELNYYIFSVSKLGWINCDFFWKVQDEKIDYYVKVDSLSKPNIKLVFKQTKSILTGTLKGDNYIFKNVPVNQDIKIVAITFDGSKPLMAIAETKTNKQGYEKLDYKAFTIADLEKQLNSP